MIYTMPLETPAAYTHVEDASYVSIRGERLFFDELTDPRLKDVQYLDTLRAKMQAAQPFPHLVVEGWFNPRLLERVYEEFDMLPRSDWTTQFNEQARVERSRTDAAMGPASRLYFSIVGSSFFLKVLTHVTGVTALVSDPHLVGGGLHETLAGGSFGIHTDFVRHPATALNNEMVFITYLNKGWQAQWNGALELWDADHKACCNTVEPEFGRSVIMAHGSTHFHGHSKPLAPPAGVKRRSVAAYFYANRYARQYHQPGLLSNYLFNSRSRRTKNLAKQWLPPILVEGIKRLVKR